MVVTLNDSDDSESEGETSKSTNSVFGGLESMIKEARRTAEVSEINLKGERNGCMAAFYTKEIYFRLCYAASN